MAQYNERQPPDSQAVNFNKQVVTRFAGTRPGTQPVMHIAVSGDPSAASNLINSPAVIALDATNSSTGAITTNFLWVDGNGKLRISTTFPVTADSDGTVVGTQS